MQKVKYRSKVGEIADTLGIIGEAENIDDGSVKIVAEGKRKIWMLFLLKLRLSPHSAL